MKKLILLFFMCSGFVLATQTIDRNKEKIQNSVSQKDFDKLKFESEELKNEISKLKEMVEGVKDVKEASNIYYNVDQFYKSSWEKLLWTLGAIGGIGALLFNKYTNTVKSEIENSKKEIKEYTNERINNYEDLITNYKKNTIETVEKKVNDMIVQELAILNEKIIEEDSKLKEIELKMEETENNLQEMNNQINEIKKRSWLNL